MPRPKRTLTNRKKDISTNTTLMDLDSNVLSNSHVKLLMWKAEVKEKMKDARRKLNDMQKEKMAMFELEFRNSLLGIPGNVLSAPVEINDDKFRCFMLGIKNHISYAESPSPPCLTVATANKRRSRSACNVKNSTRASKRIQQTRSTSVDVYKTPKGKVRLSTIMTRKKYTVCKPPKVQNSGVQVKRIMKPDEEAISTCGSPLFVASSNLNAPHVNIPLPGGVVINIEPKSPKGALEIPDLDTKTKNQIMLLYKQLKELCDPIFD